MNPVQLSVTEVPTGPWSGDRGWQAALPLERVKGTMAVAACAVSAKVLVVGDGGGGADGRASSRWR